MIITQSNSRSLGLLVFYAFLSWLGMMLHNAQELPQLTILSPEEFYPTLVYLALLLASVLLPWKRAVSILLLIWAVLHLFGGGVLTVIPFPFLPFYPEQTFQHYLAHVIYSVAQLPLILLLCGAAPRVERSHG